MITVTEKAVEKLKEVLTKDEPYLRVFVQGGGCSGFQYGMQTEGGPAQDNDSVVELGNVKILIDPISAGYLKDAVIDYEDNLMGGGFQIKNPSAKSTCGCGSSFEP